MCIFDAYRAWTADLARRRPEKTADTYRGHVFRAAVRLGGDLATIGRTSILEYLAGQAHQSRQSIHSALNDWFTWLNRSGQRTDNPLEHAPRRSKRSGRRLRRALDEDELTRLLIAAVWYGEHGQRWTGEQVAWRILAQYATGTRPAELLAVETSHLHLNGATSHVLLYRSKTDDEQTFPLGRLGREAFGELAAGKQGRIIHVGTKQHWAQVSSLARMIGLDPEKCRPYALRHSFATHLLERGVERRVVSELMGHRDPRTLDTYTIPSAHQLRAVQVLDEPARQGVLALD